MLGCRSKVRVLMAEAFKVGVGIFLAIVQQQQTVAGSADHAIEVDVRMMAVGFILRSVLAVLRHPAECV